MMPPQQPATGPVPRPPGSSPPTAHRRIDWRRIVPLVLLVVFIAACGIAMLLLVGYDIGATALGVGVAAAVVPVPALVACFLWLDRYQPEPIGQLVFCLAWGACVATLIAFGVNSAAESEFIREGWAVSLVPVLVAPVIEESMKALGPLLLFWRRHSFSGVVDGIVFCGLSATGFAMVENILYLGGVGYARGANSGGVAGGVAGVISLFIVRILLSGFAHPLFTSMTGVGIGVAARSGARAVRLLAPTAGLVAAMIMHSAWNLMTILATRYQQPAIVLYGYFAVMVPIFLGMVSLALYLRSFEGRVTQRVLPSYVAAGWLTPPEVATLGTMGRRMAARTWARRVAGQPGADAMRGYQFAATRLALLRDGLRRGMATRPDQVEAATAEERRLLEIIAWYRSVFARDPAAPPVRWDGTRYHVPLPDGRTIALHAPALPVAPVPVVLGPYA